MHTPVKNIICSALDSDKQIISTKVENSQAAKEVNKISCDGNINIENYIDEYEVNWILDSGCTDHLINDDSCFDEFVILKNPMNVNMPDGRKLQATKVGKFKLYFETYYGKESVGMSNVYYVNGIRENLSSTSKIARNCTIVTRNSTSKIYNDKRKLATVASLDKGLYRVTG